MCDICFIEHPILLVARFIIVTVTSKFNSFFKIHFKFTVSALFRIKSKFCHFTRYRHSKTEIGCCCMNS